MIRVKVSIPGAASNADISQFTGRRDGVLDDCRFYVNAPIDTPDVWLVLEGTNPDDDTCSIPRSRTAYLAAEPAIPPGFWNESASRIEYLAQFGHVWTFNDFFHRSVRFAPPFLPWMVNANHGPSIYAPHRRDVDWFRSLQDLPKMKALSVICSAMAFSPELQLRLSFVEAIAAHFKDKVDWFGNGVRSIEDKWEGLADYKFTLAIENRYSPSMFTEKLTDSYLALTVPLYWGAPDVADFFPQDSLVQINVLDLAGSIATIEELIEGDSYDSFAHGLLQAKSLVTDEYNLFVRLARVAQELSGTDTGSSELVRIRPWDKRTLRRRVVNGVGWRAESWARRLQRAG